MNAPPVIGPRCLECDGLSKLVKGHVIYPHRPDLYAKNFYQCAGCKAYCGCHPGTDNPLGRPAGPRTRLARQDAHKAFDKLWKRGTMTRGDAYRWLRKRMKLTVDECHIGMMTYEQAKEVVQHVLRIQAKPTKPEELRA